MELQTQVEWHSVPVRGMTCESCVRSITDGVSSVPGVREVTVSLAESMARVCLTPDGSLQRVVEKIEELGFETSPLCQIS
ncbi:UNVERIFIED_CONTAM: hypothetical protein B566_EDAN019152, partial [Ephemera danica]